VELGHKPRHFARYVGSGYFPKPLLSYRCLYSQHLSSFAVYRSLSLEYNIAASYVLVPLPPAMTFPGVV